jgi:hypothetical protein
VTEPKAQPPEPTPEDVDRVLAESHGDERAAIAALLHDIAVLAEDGARARGAVSSGYARGRHRRAGDR